MNVEEMILEVEQCSKHECLLPTRSAIAIIAKLRAAEELVKRIAYLENDIHERLQYPDYARLFTAVTEYERAGGSGE